MDAPFRFGIEEEFFLADAATRGTPPRAATRAFHGAAHTQLPQAERELMQAQVEIASPPATDFAEARGELARLRGRLAALGREHGLLLLASGTQPLARWRRQHHTRKQRYDALVQELQMIGRRNLVCGMHVHVEVPHPDDRVDLMNRLMPFTPLLLALSASSPFWQREDTGLAAYRLSVWGELPRTGLPELFADTADYDRFVAAMTQAGAIADASYLWWTLRPSLRYPTLELRVADSCTRLDDVLAIAALFRCLVRLAVRRPELHRGQTGSARAIAAENLWRAQRDGVGARFIRPEGGEAVPFAEALDEVLAAVAEDAGALGCTATLARVRAIAQGDTSADRQRAIFADTLTRTGDAAVALRDVVDWIAATTG